jgi:hypothetical protein
VIERLVENWLLSSGERGYEVPFAQLLAAEEHRVIQGPVHHPFEHGKDILTFAPNGELHAYQLKGPDLVKLEDFEKIQGQLLALAGTAITHPAVTPARRADRVFLVTNATLTPPVRDRIEKFNTANVPFGWPPIEPIEREQLLNRFVAAHGKYLPQSLPDIRTLLELYYSDPASLLPVRDFAKYLSSILPFPPDEASLPDCRRAIASVTLLTAYAAASWARAGNHLCVAQAWLTACVTLLRFAAVRQLDAKHWTTSYELALEAARMALASLSAEAAEAKDLVVPDLMDGVVYSSRALLVCGFVGAYFLSERTLGNVDDSTSSAVRTVLTREAPHVKIAGESAVPGLLTMAAALEQLGEIQRAEGMAISLVRTLATMNQRHSGAALADPYHDIEQVLLHQIGADSDLEGEEFDGRSYMLHVAVEWVTRRLWRQHLAMMWPDITQVEFLELQPSAPDKYLAVHDSEAELRMWFAGQPQSWSALLTQARTLDRGRLPQVLWARREMIPYLTLLFPYRLTATFAGAIDDVATAPSGH